MWLVALDAHEDDDIDFDDLFSRARGEVGLKHDTVADMMGIKGPQLSQQLKKRGHISLFRVALVAFNKDPRGKLFVAALLRLMAEELGLGSCDPLARAVAQSLRAQSTVVELLGQMHLHMAKAELVESVPQRRRA